MKLVKCALPHSLCNSHVYCKMGEILEEKSSVLLGFKDCLPVITNSVANCEKNNEGPSKKILKLQVDPNTGEKFINLNGKKLKMVPESQIKSQFSLKKNLLMKSAKSFRILTKIPFNPNLVHKIQPMKTESHLNLSTTENVDPSSSQPPILNERNFISHKNPADKDNKNIFGNLVKEITADNKGKCEYIDCVTADSIKCTQRIPAFNKIDMKVYSNDKKDQSLDSKKCSTSQICETLKDAAIQTNENDIINLPPDLGKQTDNILGFDLSDLNNDLNFDDFNSILFEGVDPILVSPPVQGTSLAAKFFGELRRAHFPDYEGNM